jgi:lysophospholipase L1-like esterase
MGRTLNIKNRFSVEDTAIRFNKEGWKRRVNVTGPPIFPGASLFGAGSAFSFNGSGVPSTDGIPVANQGSASGSTVTGVELIRTTATPGRSHFIKSINLWTSKKMLIEIMTTIDGYTFQGIDAELWHVVNGSHVFELNDVIDHPARVTVRMCGPVDSTDDLVAVGSIHYYDLTNDFNYAADKTILWLGDSIAYGGTFEISDNDQLFTFKTRNYYLDKGIDVRLVNKSSPSATVADYERMRKSDNITIGSADLIFYQLGANDAPTITASPANQATLRANVENIVSWKQLRYPDATLVLCSPTPLQNETSQTGNETIASIYADIVADEDDDKVKFMALHESFDNTDESYYVAADASGSKIHPTVSGHAAIATTIQTWLDANVPTI